MDKKDFDNLFNGNESVEDFLNNDSGTIVDPIDHAKTIEELRAKAKAVEDEYKLVVQNFDFSSDGDVEEFAKQEMMKTIIEERKLASRSESMMEHVFEMMAKDPDKRLINSFVKISELMTKLNDNIISNISGLNKLIIDRKNSERKDIQLNLQVDKLENITNNNLQIGDTSQKMTFNLEDLDEFRDTGKLEVYEPCEIE